MLHDQCHAHAGCGHRQHCCRAIPVPPVFLRLRGQHMGSSKAPREQQAYESECACGPNIRIPEDFVGHTRFGLFHSTGHPSPDARKSGNANGGLKLTPIFFAQRFKNDTPQILTCPAIGRMRALSSCTKTEIRTYKTRCLLKYFDGNPYNFPRCNKNIGRRRKGLFPENCALARNDRSSQRGDKWPKIAEHLQQKRCCRDQAKYQITQKSRCVNFQLRALDPGDGCSSLSLGDEIYAPLKSFLRREAKKLHKENLARTFVLVEEGKTRVWAYVTTLCTQVSVEQFNEPALVDGFRYKDYPAIRLARLAVDKEVQRSGAGGQLIDFVIGIAVEHVMPHTGCRFLIVDSKPPSVSYYTKKGFQKIGIVDDGDGQQTSMFIDLLRLPSK
jgi:GNAT superfamily N-acetyltransferase